MDSTINGVIVPESVESWVCKVDSKLKNFYRTMEEGVFHYWMESRTGHRVPGCTPLKGGGFAGFMFTGEGERALASISARAVQRRKLTIVIDRYATQPEDIDPDYATWAEVGLEATTWLRDWIYRNYDVEPVAQRAGRPSADDYSATGDQGRKVESVTPEAIRAALAPLRDTPAFWPEVERLVRDLSLIHI